MKEDTNRKILQLSKLHFNLMMAVCVIFWAFAFPLIKIGLEELSFINLTIMRFFIVVIVILVILLLQYKRFSKIHKKDILPIFLLGFFGVIVYHLGLNYGERLISPGTASLIIATIPIFIVILARVFLKEKIGMKKLIGITIAICGVILISLWGTLEATKESIIEPINQMEYIYAPIAVLIAAIMGAIYTIAGKKLLERYSGFSLTIYAMLFGSIGLIPFLNKSLIYELSNLSSTGWFAIIFLGIFSTIIGYGIWYIALEMKSASEISIYLYAIPVITTIISYIWLGYHITGYYFLGGSLIILGLIFVNFKNNNKKID